MIEIKNDSIFERNEIIEVRCSEEEKHKIERNSARRNQSVEAYLLERGLKSTGRRSPKSRERAEAIVNIQQIINELELDEKQRRLSKKDDIRIIQEGVDRLWET